MSEAERAADELAAALMAAPIELREDLLRRSPVVSGLALAWALKRLSQATWSSDPAATARAAELTAALASDGSSTEIEALASWTHGIALLAEGSMEDALVALSAASTTFANVGRMHDRAEVQISQMMALAMLGRSDEAATCGDEALHVLHQHGDLRAIAKVELNMGNLAAQRDRYGEATEHYKNAADRFSATGDTELRLRAISGSADMLARQHDFAAAEHLYVEALSIAQTEKHEMVVASVVGDLGMMELRRGRYDRALGFLEESRQKFASLDATQYLAVAEESLADAYAELNLLPEALTLYERSLATYEASELRTEQAWAHSQRARALLLSGRLAAAGRSLDTASDLFSADGNAIGVALVQVWGAELALAEGNAKRAASLVRRAEGPLLSAKQMSWYLHVQGVLAKALRADEERAEATRVAESMLDSAIAYALPQSQQVAHLLLGHMARDRGDRATAREHYEAAVTSIESLRGSLPGEAFRSAFLGDKLEPYRELVRLSLADGGPEAARQALAWVERGRARALADQMDDPAGTDPVASADSISRDRAATLRERLNDCYRQLAHPLAELSADPDRLLGEVRALEAGLLEIDRRRALDGNQPGGTVRPASGATDLDALQRALGDDAVLVEYFALDDALHAYIVDARGFDCVALPLGLAAASQAIEQLRFQTDTLRHGSDRLAHRLPELQRRALHHLQALHAGLWAPLLPRLGARRVVVVPHGVLHYLPFEALHDGQAHEIERRELVRCASAGVLLRCLARPATGFDRALVLGHADARLPQVGREVERVARLFPGALALRDAAATGAALREHGGTQELLHIACHAMFRNDNPRFSALHLADGAFTARDAARLRLRCGLLTLSACETGVSAVMPGDELIGLTHAFLAAGAASVLASLWTVQDDTTAALMEAFYTRLRAGARPAAALRAAQCDALRRQPHPYFWSAFSLHGRW